MIKNDDAVSGRNYLQLGKYFPPNWGGIESVTYNLAIGLTQLGEVNAVIAYGESNSTEKLSVGDKIAKIYSSKHVKFFRAPISIHYYLDFKSLVANYDVVIVHLPNPFGVISLMLSGYKGKVVLYWHSDIVNKGVLGWLLKPLEYWVISRAEVVIAPTKAHLQFSRFASLLQKKGKVVPYPINPSLLAVADLHRKLQRTLIEKNEIRILAIGRLVEYKGLEYLIRAIPSLLRKRRIIVDILGDGPLRESLLSLIVQLGLEQFVILHGAVSEVERNNYLSIADIFCFPSITKQEMYGIVQIEAMAYGLPIISTNIPGSGSPELIRMTGAGITIQPCSAEQIELAVMRLIEEPELYSLLSNSGLNAIDQIFNPSVLIKQFCEFC